MSKVFLKSKKKSWNAILNKTYQVDQTMLNKRNLKTHLNEKKEAVVIGQKK